MGLTPHIMINMVEWRRFMSRKCFDQKSWMKAAKKNFEQTMLTKKLFFTQVSSTNCKQKFLTKVKTVNKKRYNKSGEANRPLTRAGWQGVAKGWFQLLMIYYKLVMRIDNDWSSVLLVCNVKINYPPETRGLVPPWHWDNGEIGWLFLVG